MGANRFSAFCIYLLEVGGYVVEAIVAYWHELSRFRERIGRYWVDYQTRQWVWRSAPNLEIFEAYYERKEVSGHSEYPAGWVQLWPLNPITAPTAHEARDKALPLLEVVANGSQDELFEQRACPVPIHRKKLKEIQSPTHRAFACIYKHAETRYEVRYFGAFVGDDQEDGWRLSVPEVEGMPVPRGFEMLTIADSLESAIQAAVLELECIVSTGEIKPK